MVFGALLLLWRIPVLWVPGDAVGVGLLVLGALRDPQTSIVWGPARPQAEGLRNGFGRSQGMVLGGARVMCWDGFEKGLGRVVG